MFRLFLHFMLSVLHDCVHSLFLDWSFGIEIVFTGQRVVSVQGGSDVNVVDIVLLLDLETFVLLLRFIGNGVVAV